MAFGVPDVADGCVGPGVAARPDGSCDGRFIYRSLPAGSPGVTANLPSWPHDYSPGWKRLEADVAREGDEDEYEALSPRASSRA